jgi:hypothetical protein
MRRSKKSSARVMPAAGSTNTYTIEETRLIRPREAGGDEHRRDPDDWTEKSDGAVHERADCEDSQLVAAYQFAAALQA